MKTSTNAMTANAQTIKFFTFDHVHKQIIGSQFNFDKSGIFGTDQYAALMNAMEKHPNYELFPVAPVKEKQTYQGLNKQFMDKYIQAVADEAIKAQYQKYLDKKTHFATIKSWFLEVYQGFTMENAMRELRKHTKSENQKKLVAVKKSVRQSVEEEMKKHKLTVVEKATITETDDIPA